MFEPSGIYFIWVVYLLEHTVNEIRQCYSILAYFYFALYPQDVFKGGAHSSQEQISTFYHSFQSLFHKTCIDCNDLMIFFFLNEAFNIILSDFDTLYTVAADMQMPSLEFEYTSGIVNW